MTSWWCEYAALPDGVARDVTIQADAGRITGVRPDTRPTSDTARLAGLTLPGFANAHSHAFHRALRSRVQADRGTFWTWRDTMYRAAERLEPDSYHRLARGVFAEMVQCGMACVGEFHYLHHGPDGSPYDDPNAMGEALLEAAADVGLRITLLDTLYLHGGLAADGHRPPEGVQRRFSDGTVERWMERVSVLPSDDRRRAGAAVHSVRAVDPEAVRAVAAWASAAGVPVHAHVSEQRAENEQTLAAFGCTPTALLADAGMLATDFTAVHATHLDAADIDHLGQATVCLCPTTERDLGDGIGPSRELRDAGVRLTLGSDSHAVIDQMVEARAVELQERLRSEARGVHAAADLLAMATVEGHRSLGWTDAGVLEIGARADLVTIAFESVRLAGAPADLLVESAVFASTAGDITSVVIDGDTVVCDGRHVRVDAAAELAAAIEEVFA